MRTLRPLLLQAALLLLGLLTASAPTAGRAAAESRPNIVFVISDDHRWDSLGVAGNQAIQTPRLDRLASEGAYFRQGTIHIPQCSPSRATLLTGLPPHRHGYYSNQHQRPEAATRDGLRAPTLPGLLQGAGYRTVLVGKWHLAPDPWNTGFSDVRVWMPAGSGPFTDPRLATGNSRMVQRTPGFTTELFANDAVEFVKSPQARERPFFMWLATTAPHLPMRPNPERFEKLYAGKTPEELAAPTFPKGTTTRGGNWPDYYAAISHTDEQVGRVLDALAEQKLAQNTVVVFLGDNGYMMGSRGWNGKVYPYEESVRVPFIIHAPHLKGLKGTSDSPVSSLDLPPTLLSLAGVTPPKEWPGRDLTPLLKGTQKDGVREAFCEWADNQSERFGTLGYRLVRTPTHKLIRWEQPDKPDELYHLTEDPQEAKNLAAEPSARAIRDDLDARLRAWMDRTSDPARQWKKP